MLTVITLPTDLVSGISTTASGFVSDLNPVVTLILGILLATAVVGWLISHFTHPR